VRGNLKKDRVTSVNGGLSEKVVGFCWASLPWWGKPRSEKKERQESIKPILG